MLKIFLRRTNSSGRKQKGFTLIEIMIVLAILGAISVIGFQKFNRTENIKSIVRKLNTLCREVRTRSRLNGKSYRIVLQMDDKEGHSYWVESSSRTELIDPEKDPEAEEKKLSEMSAEEKEAKAAAGGFSLASDILKKPVELPSGWYFAEIETQFQKNAKSEGKSYINFLPQGIAEESAIHITNREKTTWTLHILAIKGNPDLYTEKKTLKELTQ